MVQNSSCEVLEKMLVLHASESEVNLVHDKLLKLQLNLNENVNKVIELYHQAIPLFEQYLWAGDYLPDDLNLYHQLFHELECLESPGVNDRRFEFLIVVPVADRPQHLTSLMESLLGLCEAFNYGGYSNNRYNKISILIADDSAKEESIFQNKLIAEKFTKKGLATHYFGIDEQQRQLEKLTEAERDHLISIVGDHDGSCFSHKGASIMRNITYLKLNEMVEDNKKLLFYFVDSDQEFKVNISNRDEAIYAVNYFYHLDQIFAKSNIVVITGKVVGDPPVSPSVMAGKFLDDVIKFLNEMSNHKPEDDCGFHDQVSENTDDASYHDMAELFGFKSSGDAFSYHCTISQAHTNAQCFNEFINKASRFFDGEHLTRKTCYKFENVNSSIKPARTVYTGNYIIKPSSLKYYIPFANLKLRMAGPVLGRIIKSEIGDKFCSANLPMLHMRTVQHIGQSEFRPGISRESESVDLSGEFERQFFGDVMLFTIERLTELGYPKSATDKKLVEQTLLSVEEKIDLQYSKRHNEIVKKLVSLKSIFNDDKCWWNSRSDMESTINRLDCFINNMDKNFGEDSQSYKLIKLNSKIRRNNILNAILDYPENRASWEKVIS